MPLHHSCAATTLTSWHLLVTFCSLHVAQWVKLFEHKPFDSRTVMGFGILNGVSIGLLNLSLGFNSVGFYQVNRSQLSMCSQNWIDQVQDAI
jgi:solute carrier family 35 protein E3